MASSTTATKIINAETAKRQFVLNPRNRPVTEETKKLIDRLLLERLSIAAICRVSGISETWMSPLRIAENTAPYFNKLQLAQKKRTFDNFLVMRCGRTRVRKGGIFSDE